MQSDANEGLSMTTRTKRRREHTRVTD